MPGEIEALRLDPAVSERAEEPAEEAFLEVRRDVVDEAGDPALDPVDEVAEEADRVGDDVSDHVRRLREDVQEHVLQLEDRLHHADDGVEGLRDEPAVGRLQLVDPGVERIAGGDVFLRDRVDERVLLAVDLAREVLPLLGELPFGVLADLLQIVRELRDVVVNLGAAGRDLDAGGVQLAADEIRHLPDHRVHRRQVAGTALRVEGVHLVGHPEELVLEPAGAPEDPVVAVRLVGVHLRADEVLELRSGARLAGA